MRNSNGMSTGMALLCTLGVMLLIGAVMESFEPKCAKSGCKNDVREGSRYCYIHDNSYTHDDYARGVNDALDDWDEYGDDW